MQQPPDVPNTSARLQHWIDRGPSMARPEATPHWLEAMVSALRGATPAQLSTNDPPALGVAARQAAVLVLVGGSADEEPEVVLLERARELHDHGGEVGFPGGGWEPGDASPVVTALREAQEEIGVDPAGIDPLIVLPRLAIRASGFEVTAVVGYWREPSPIGPADPAETHRVLGQFTPDSAAEQVEHVDCPRVERTQLFARRCDRRLGLHR